MLILQRYGEDDELTLIEVEKNEANKWKWDWLEKSVDVDPSKVVPKSGWSKGSINVLVKNYIRKVDVAGKALCNLCDGVYIKYGSTGFKAISDHLKSKKHVRNVITTQFQGHI